MIKQNVLAHNNVLLFADKILWESLCKITGGKDTILWKTVYNQIHWENREYFCRICFNDFVYLFVNIWLCMNMIWRM